MKFDKSFVVYSEFLKPFSLQLAAGKDEDTAESELNLKVAAWKTEKIFTGMRGTDQLHHSVVSFCNDETPQCA